MSNIPVAMGSTEKVAGTFSARAAQLLGLGANTAADRTAKATEETAKNTRRLAAREFVWVA